MANEAVNKTGIPQQTRQTWTGWWHSKPAASQGVAGTGDSMASADGANNEEAPKLSWKEYFVSTRFYVRGMEAGSVFCRAIKKNAYAFVNFFRAIAGYPLWDCPCKPAADKPDAVQELAK